jgi:hypothetical protein
MNGHERLITSHPTAAARNQICSLITETLDLLVLSSWTDQLHSFHVLSHKGGRIIILEGAVLVVVETE